MISLPYSGNQFGPSVSTAADLPTGDPRGKLRVVLDELAIYISDGSEYAPIPSGSPFALSALPAKSEKKENEKINTLEHDISALQKSVQSAFDLVASLPKPEPFPQHIDISIDPLIEEISNLRNQLEKQEIEMEIIQGLLTMRTKQIENVEDTLSHHAVKLDNPVSNVQFASVVQFLLWLFTFGFFGRGETK